VWVDAATDIITADQGEPAPEGPRSQLLSGRITHQKVPSVRGYYAGVEGVIHSAIGPWTVW